VRTFSCMLSENSSDDFLPEGFRSMSLFIRETSTLYSLRTEVQRMRILLVHLWLTFPFFTGGIVFFDLVTQLLSRLTKDTDEEPSQKERKTLQTYELLIPAGAPGGSGYTDPVIRFVSPWRRRRTELSFDRTCSSIEDPMFRLFRYIQPAISSLLAMWMDL
jgi:hypothetical protein